MLKGNIAKIINNGTLSLHTLALFLYKLYVSGLIEDVGVGIQS